HHHHGHDHDHRHEAAAALPAAFDTSVPDEALTPEQQSRRTLLRRAGLLGAGLTVANVLPHHTRAAAAPAYATTDGRKRGGFLWLAGDHHIHTQYSNDGKYRVVDQVRQGARHGLDWMVITDHGNETHAKIGVEKVNPDIKEARAAYEDTLVFQGLEWNIPAAEHGTVFVHPGRNEVSVLKQFETDYDGGVKKATDSTPANEALAIAGLNFLADQVRRRKVKDILMLANHPARKGIDSPHEIRAWRDATSARHRIAVGMEGAPGHQAAGIEKSVGMGRARGLYDGSPGANSFAGYPLESYRTWGGFDWMTATVGGLWDSLLAEGKPWWITANSDSHNVYTDTAKRGGPDSDYTANGKHTDPVYSGRIDLT
ncbi:MAG TPA: PHP domain-containing protein, partial [Acidimicrobiales bacterium]|nr:PHP domain-containing protein [Acidimicrobiales bacterium]